MHFSAHARLGIAPNVHSQVVKDVLLPPHPQVISPVSRKRFAQSYAGLLIVKRNASVGNVPMCSASQTAFSAVSDPLLESANLRKIHNLAALTHIHGHKFSRRALAL